MLKKVEKSIFFTKPIIGIVARKVNNIYKINQSLVNKINKVGGIPILILPTNFNDLDKVLNLCDGIIMPGGKEIFDYDKYICEYAKKKDVPILGICLGMQVMCSEYLDNTKCNHQNIVHRIVTKSGSIVNKTVGDVFVNSRHNECITNSNDYIVTAYSLDGTIEAIEYPYNKFNIGVQWHPEDLETDELFIEFINVCIDKDK